MYARQNPSSLRKPLLEGHDDESQELNSEIFMISSEPNNKALLLSQGSSSNSLGDDIFSMKDRHEDENDFSTSYDFVLVTQWEESVVDGISDFCKQLMSHLEESGVDFISFRGVQLDDLYILMRVSLPQIQAFANFIQYKLPLDSRFVQRLLEEGDAESGIKPSPITHNPEESLFTPYQFLYAPYITNASVDNKIYARGKSMEHPFGQTVRLRLTQFMIETMTIPQRLKHKSDYEEVDDINLSVNIRSRLSAGTIKAFYPLHCNLVLNKLYSKCMPLHILPWHLPTREIGKYFGFSISLYFDFMHHFCYFLILPAFLGLLLQLVVFVTGDYSSVAQIIFSVLILLWGRIMLEKWKRKQALIAMKNGMAGFEENELNRPEYTGKLMRSHIDGHFIIYFSNKQRRHKQMMSFTVISVLIFLVISMVASIYVMRVSLSDSLGVNAQFLASLVNAVQIQICAHFYTKIADFLTEYENHRTDTEFSDSMIIKLFLFSFVNSYASFFYIAFVAEYFNDCGGGTCMPALALNLGVIFFIRELSGVVSQDLLPWYQHEKQLNKEVNKVKESKSTRKVLTQAEIQYLFPRYDSMKDPIEEYSEVVLQYGYLVLFASALPMSAFVALVSSCIERPTFHDAEDIGAWEAILSFLSMLAVVTNAGIILFTMNIFDDHSNMFRFWFFVTFQWILFSFQYFIDIMIPDIPSSVRIQKSRQEFVYNKLILKLDDSCDGNIDKSESCSSYNLVQPFESNGKVLIDFQVSSPSVKDINPYKSERSLLLTTSHSSSSSRRSLLAAEHLRKNASYVTSSPQAKNNKIKFANVIANLSKKNNNQIENETSKWKTVKNHIGGTSSLSPKTTLKLETSVSSGVEYVKPGLQKQRGIHRLLQSRSLLKDDDSDNSDVEFL